jgi:Tol biopolymer transport system component
VLAGVFTSIAIDALGACSSGRSSSIPAETEPDAGGVMAADEASPPPDDAYSTGDALSVTPPIDDADTPRGVDGGPGGPWIAFTSKRTGRFGIFLVHPDGTGLVPLVTDGGENILPSWSPDGSKIAFASTRGNDAGGYSLYVVEVGTTAVSAVSTGLGSAISPAWSPDGLLIAFSGPDGLYTVPAAGGAASAITSGGYRDNSPAWAPDGAALYFASNRSDGGTFDVWSVQPDGGGLVQVTTGTYILGAPAVSPDGKTLALTQSGSGSSTQVVFFDLATKALTVFSAMNDSEPAFAPSGTQLATTTLRYTGTSEVAVLDIPGATSPFFLTPDGGGNNGQVAYQPTF